MAETKRGALLPENAVGGGAVPDGEYTIKHCVAQMFDYGGTVEEPVPAITVLFKADDGADFEQSYSAGKGSKLHSSGDGKRFEIIGKNSNAFALLVSLRNSGFPQERVDDDVTVFDGTRVQIVNQAQPKRPGIKDQVEGKTIPLVTKVLKLPGEKATAAPKSAPAAAKTSTASAGAPTATVASTNNGDLNGTTIEFIQAILSEAPDNAITRVKLSTQVMLRAAKDQTLKANMTTLKKLAGDAAWLVENAEAGGWVTDGESITLGGVA